MSIKNGMLTNIRVIIRAANMYLSPRPYIYIILNSEPKVKPFLVKEM